MKICQIAVAGSEGRAQKVQKSRHAIVQKVTSLYYIRWESLEVSKFTKTVRDAAEKACSIPKWSSL